MLQQRPDNADLQLAKLLLRDAVSWLALEIADRDYEQKNEIFWLHNDSRSGYAQRFRAAADFRYRLIIPELQHTGDTMLRLEQEVDCLTLAQAETGERTDFDAKTVSREDAREIAALCAQNFLYQVFETGLVHPDIHPGNLVIGRDNELHPLDRKALIEISDTDRVFMKNLLLDAMGAQGPAAVITRLANRFAAGMPKRDQQQLVARLGELVEQRRSSGAGAMEDYIAPVLLELRKAGVEIPLDIELVFKSLLGANRIAVWAGFDNFAQAVAYSPSGSTNYVDLLKRIHPSVGTIEMTRIGAVLAKAGLRARRTKGGVSS